MSPSYYTLALTSLSKKTDPFPAIAYLQICGLLTGRAQPYLQILLVLLQPPARVARLLQRGAELPLAPPPPLLVLGQPAPAVGRLALGRVSGRLRLAQL